jgi:hypothetical protein
MPTVAAYVRHAEEFGGLADVWQVASRDLAGALELGELAAALRGLGARQRRVGRKGKSVTVERFTLSHQETAELIARLIEAGVGDTDIRRYAGASESMVGAIRRDRGSDPHISPDLDPAPRGVIRNKIANPGDRPSAAVQALRSPDSRTCEWCSAPLASTLRAGARYCIGGRCKMAAHRSRRASRLDVRRVGA